MLRSHHCTTPAPAEHVLTLVPFSAIFLEAMWVRRAFDSLRCLFVLSRTKNYFRRIGKTYRGCHVCISLVDLSLHPPRNACVETSCYQDSLTLVPIDFAFSLFYVTYVTRARHTISGGLATIDEDSLLSKLIKSVRLCVREEMLAVRIAAIKAPASKMSDFNFADVALEPKISSYAVPVPATDDISVGRIDEIVRLISNFRGKKM
jgi:hypothetical protein